MHPNPGRNDQLARLFLALWPPREVRDALSCYGDLWLWPQKVARVRDEKLHLTLHFIGDIERERIPELRAALRNAFEPFDIALGYPELWPHGIAVLRPHTQQDALTALHATLAARLFSQGLPVDRREFRPHVTLARRAIDAKLPPASPTVVWQIDRFALVESCLDAHRTYRALANYTAAGEIA